MTSLGEFGTPREPVEETFGYFGETVRVNPDLTDLVILDTVDLEALENDPAAAVHRFIASVVHEDDVATFWQAARRNRQSTDDVTTTLAKVIEAVTDRPTMRPSDSSDGPPATAANSTADSSSRALQLLEGRPDLQLMVLQARDEMSRAG